jgi:hypothetical protein
MKRLSSLSHGRKLLLVLTYERGPGNGASSRAKPVAGRSRRPDSNRDPFITSVGPVSPQVARSRAKPHDSERSGRPRWRPKTPNGKRVDPRRPRTAVEPEKSRAGGLSPARVPAMG